MQSLDFWLGILAEFHQEKVQSCQFRHPSSCCGSEPSWTGVSLLQWAGGSVGGSRGAGRRARCIQHGWQCPPKPRRLAWFEKCVLLALSFLISSLLQQKKKMGLCSVAVRYPSARGQVHPHRQICPVQCLLMLLCQWFTVGRERPQRGLSPRAFFCASHFLSFCFAAHISFLCYSPFPLSRLALSAVAVRLESSGAVQLWLSLGATSATPLTGRLPSALEIPGDACSASHRWAYHFGIQADSRLLFFFFQAR